jgi:hypothetical protein
MKIYTLLIIRKFFGLNLIDYPSRNLHSLCSHRYTPHNVQDLNIPFLKKSHQPLLTTYSTTSPATSTPQASKIPLPEGVPFTSKILNPSGPSTRSTPAYTAPTACAARQCFNLSRHGPGFGFRHRLLIHEPLGAAL